MAKKYLLIDDDVNIRKMLSLLIKKNQLGRVIEEVSSGEHAVDEVMFYNPDIVIIDLSLPGMDGIEIIKQSKIKGYKGKFIMISQVEDEKMRAEAYENGIYFFISKPINSIEGVNIIKQVCRNIDLEQSVAVIKNAVLDIGVVKNKISETGIDEKIDKIFNEIGILSETGSRELKELIFIILDIRRRTNTSNYQLNKIYEDIAVKLKNDTNIKVNKRTIEKRIRRAIQKSMQTIAELGKDDYYNLKFTEYSTLLFDFKEVKKEMRRIENPQNSSGKVSIKKFVEGMVSKITPK